MTPVLLREHREAFGPWLRGERAARGLTLRVAAERLGVSFAKLQKMETGGRFRIHSLALLDDIAALYELPVHAVREAAGVRSEAPPVHEVPELASNHSGMWAWSCSRGWTPIRDFLDEHDVGADGDVAKMMEAAGYGPAAEVTFGAEYAVMVEVHGPFPGRVSRPPYNYLVWVNVGGTCESVACATLPDLLGLLRELKPLAEPPFIGLAAGTGWSAGGRPVGAFGLTPNGAVHALVPAERPEQTGLVVGAGGCRRG